jgi:hypothetical protein
MAPSTRLVNGQKCPSCGNTVAPPMHVCHAIRDNYAVDEQPAADYQKVAVANIMVGDLIDLEGDPYNDANDPLAEFELARVIGFEVETDDCVRIDFDRTSIGFPPGHLLKRVKRGIPERTRLNPRIAISPPALRAAGQWVECGDEMAIAEIEWTDDDELLVLQGDSWALFDTEGRKKDAV